jgi:hypothetical protein
MKSIFLESKGILFLEIKPLVQMHSGCKLQIYFAAGTDSGKFFSLSNHIAQDWKQLEFLPFDLKKNLKYNQYIPYV